MSWCGSWGWGQVTARKWSQKGSGQFLSRSRWEGDIRPGFHSLNSFTPAQPSCPLRIPRRWSSPEPVARTCSPLSPKIYRLPSGALHSAPERWVLLSGKLYFSFLLLSVYNLGHCDCLAAFPAWRVFQGMQETLLSGKKRAYFYISKYTWLQTSRVTRREKAVKRVSMFWLQMFLKITFKKTFREI